MDVAQETILVGQILPNWCGFFAFSDLQSSCYTLISTSSLKNITAISKAKFSEVDFTNQTAAFFKNKPPQMVPTDLNIGFHQGFVDLDLIQGRIYNARHPRSPGRRSCEGFKNSSLKFARRAEGDVDTRNQSGFNL